MFDISFRCLNTLKHCIQINIELPIFIYVLINHCSYTTTSSTNNNNNKYYYGGTYSPHPLLGDPCFLHGPQRVHEPAPVAWVLWWRLADVEHCRAVGPGRQTQHFHQTANCLVAYSAPIPRRQALYCPVGVTLEAEERNREADTGCECTLLNS